MRKLQISLFLFACLAAAPLSAQGNASVARHSGGGWQVALAITGLLLIAAGYYLLSWRPKSQAPARWTDLAGDSIRDPMGLLKLPIHVAKVPLSRFSKDSLFEYGNKRENRLKYFIVPVYFGNATPPICIPAIAEITGISEIRFWFDYKKFKNRNTSSAGSVGWDELFAAAIKVAEKSNLITFSAHSQPKVSA